VSVARASTPVIGGNPIPPHKEEYFDDLAHAEKPAMLKTKNAPEPLKRVKD
jgi:hypothetical protein